jgi:hypothetical protein
VSCIEEWEGQRRESESEKRKENERTNGRVNEVAVVVIVSGEGAVVRRRGCTKNVEG